MRIYISEKHLDLELFSKEKELVVSNDFDILAIMDDEDGWNILTEVQENTEIETIEQHDKELLQEFADKLYNDLNTLTRHGYTDDQWEEDCISKGDVEDLVIRLLKERGVE